MRSTALMLAALALSATAGAEEPPTGDWYGYQTLLVDAAALGAGLAALSYRKEIHAGSFGSPSMVLGTVAGATWLLGPAVVHFSHSRADLGGFSIGLRLALPIAAALASVPLVTLAYYGDPGFVYAISVVIGAALVVPIVIDAISAHERAPLRIAGLPVAVYALPARRGATCGLAFAF